MSEQKDFNSSGGTVQEDTASELSIESLSSMDKEGLQKAKLIEEILRQKQNRLIASQSLVDKKIILAKVMPFAMRWLDIMSTLSTELTSKVYGVDIETVADVLDQFSKEKIEELKALLNAEG